MIECMSNYTQSGEKWEEFINKCYRLRYQKDGYHEIPATYQGDGGIEGFTDTGIVYQCYCPEKNYSDNDYYEHLRDKMHTDIGKFIDPNYGKTLVKLGVHDVREWHLVIPEYRDKRILEYRTTQITRVKNYKDANPKQCIYIADDFRIDIKVAEDFLVEFSRLTRLQQGNEIDLREIVKEKEIDLSSCPSEKAENIRRKIKAVSNKDEESDEYKSMVNIFLNAYISGISWMDKLRRENSDIYEELMSLKASYKRRVETKTLLQNDHSMNYSVFMEILNDFISEIKTKFNYLNQETIDELAYDIIGEWLADCPMEFKL